MLILSRKSGESIVIGEGGTMVRLTVISIRGDHVRLGFDADESVIILRQEIADAKAREAGDAE